MLPLPEIDGVTLEVMEYQKEADGAFAKMGFKGETHAPPYIWRFRCPRGVYKEYEVQDITGELTMTGFMMDARANREAENFSTIEEAAAVQEAKKIRLKANLTITGLAILWIIAIFCYLDLRGYFTDETEDPYTQPSTWETLQ